MIEPVLDRSYDATSNTVDVLVSRLRRKIDGGRVGCLLHTRRGVGWVLYSERGPEASPEL